MQVKIPFNGTLIPNFKFNWTLSDRDNDIWQQIGNTRLDLRYTQCCSTGGSLYCCSYDCVRNDYRKEGGLLLRAHVIIGKKSV